MTSRRERAFDSLALVALKLIVGAWVLHHGFSHVSDDDYARTVIAERFAQAPRIDPSGTSWLPLPFWLEGGAMWATGRRTLGAARAIAVFLGSASVAAPYLALRASSMGRLSAWIATAIALSVPWNAWLGVATVPEAWVGALVASAAFAMARPPGRPWAALALLAASLSRYESWPACVVLAALGAWHAARAKRLRPIACAAVALAGPLVWMAWNAHAHGSAFHFVARVTSFRRATGAGGIPLVDKLLAYPRALGEDTPGVAALAALGLAGLPSLRFRARWGWAATTAGAILLFLVWGEARDGAPTHHACRALAACWWIFIAMGVDAVAALVGRAPDRPDGLEAPWRRPVLRGLGAAAACAAAVVWCATLPSRWADAPGRRADECRDAQIARGLGLRARGIQSVHVSPCAFEHFALLAAWGRPEDATIDAPTHAPVTERCPRISGER